MTTTAAGPTAHTEPDPEPDPEQQTDQQQTDREPGPGAGRSGRAWYRSIGPAAVALLLLLTVAVLAVINLTQGTAEVGPTQIWRALTGDVDQGDASVIVASRLPRMFAGLLVGLALGAAGAALQAVTRNILASPDTLAVNAGAYFALTLTAVTGLTLPLLASSGLAFLGGLLTAATVLALSGPGSGTVRMVLAGSALALGVSAVTDALVLLFPQNTGGLFRWNAGSISQSGTDGVIQMAPVIGLCLLGLLLLARRVDALALGDDAAQGLGVAVRATRIRVLVLAVLLSTAAVTLAGPIGFVGLCAPALLRPLAHAVPGVTRSRLFLPLAGLVGAALVLAADVLLRAVVGAQASVSVPTGVITTLVGAIFLVALAFHSYDSGSSSPNSRIRIVSSARFAATVIALVLLAVLITIAAALLGDAKLLLGDVLNWIRGDAGRVVSYVLDTRSPRVLAALAAGAALALAGTAVQAVTRNPLAEPGILGVSGGAGLGAVIVVTMVPLAGSWMISGAALAGAVITAIAVFGLAARSGFQQNRLVLIGFGFSAGTAAVISLLIVVTDPFNAAKALTWLSGSTYGRTLPDVVPVLLVLLVVTVLLLVRHRALDLISLDDDTPRLLGLRLGPTRLFLLIAAVLLTATAVAAVGVIGFVGLVAPHAARALVGRSHHRVIPVAILLGATLVCTADLLGRTVIAPAQLGAGLLTAVIGAPYFLWLLWRSRA